MIFFNGIVEWVKQHTDKLANIAGVLGFFMALGTWAHTLLYQRRNLKISITHYDKQRRYLVFYLLIENLSRLPITISRIGITSANGTALECNLIPKIVVETTTTRKEEITKHEVLKSFNFPISLSELGGTSGFVVFEDHQDIFRDSSTVWNFQVYTNRGRALKLQLPFVHPIPLGKTF